MSKIEMCKKIVMLLCKLNNLHPSKDELDHLIDVCYLQPHDDLMKSINNLK